jgi:endonuclease-3
MDEEDHLTSSTQKLKHKAKGILLILEKEYAQVKTALNYKDPLELLVATILSAQCTDKKVNEVTKTLFKKYQTAEDYANANLLDLEQEIRQTGFYRNKSKNIKRSCQMLIEKFDGIVPSSMKELIKLPGVARKTANIVLANAYGVIEGIAVDTHVRRLSRRLGLTKEKNPEKIEMDLMEIIPKEKWAKLSNLLIFHGRRICTSRKPKCYKCLLEKYCPSAHIII